MGILGQPITVTNFSGSHTTAARNLPNHVSQLSLTVDASQMTDPQLRISVALDFSPDGGVTWASETAIPGSAFPFVDEYVGGAVDRNGQLVTSIVSMVPPFPDGTNRQTRGSLVNNSGVPLNATFTFAAV